MGVREDDGWRQIGASGVGGDPQNKINGTEKAENHWILRQTCCRHPLIVLRTWVEEWEDVEWDCVRQPAEAVAAVWGTAVMETGFDLQRQQVNLWHVTLSLQVKMTLNWLKLCFLDYSRTWEMQRTFTLQVKMTWLFLVSFLYFFYFF